MSTPKIKNIRLKNKEERRFKQGHPWVFSNELQESPKGMELGEFVQLNNSGGDFLAFGFGHPNSLIAFRELSRDPASAHFTEGRVNETFFYEKLRQALGFRKDWFSIDQSFRLIHGEADGLSGLIIDRFSGEDGVVYVVQPHAAGMDKNLEILIEALKKLSTEIKDENAVLILRRDAGSREREGLTKEPPVAMELQSGKAITELSGLQAFSFRVPGVMGKTAQLKTDLITGQKTGFFFDQLQNIRLLETLVLRKTRYQTQKSYRILDLCSYVGQWSVHLLQTLNEREIDSVEVVSVDASEKALKLAIENIDTFVKEEMSEEIKVKASRIKADVLEPIEDLGSKSFDIVIADPPAFIKSRKSIPEGKQAYVKLFQTAIERVKPGGLVVCCSCSQLLSQEDFVESLTKASRRSKKVVRWLTQGAPSFDHFTRLEFQEGQYLKCYIGQVE